MDSQSSYVSIAVHNNGTQNGLKRPMLPRKASKMAVSLAEACSGTVGKGEKTKNIFTKSTSRQNNGDYYQDGDILDKRFKILSKLGQGGYSQVYKAEFINNNAGNTEGYIQKDSMQVGEAYAIKVEKVTVVTHRLKSEAAILKKLADTNHFAKLYAFGNNGISSYMVQSLCDFDMHQLAKTRNYEGLNLKLTCQLFVQMIESTKLFHMIGYIHRDIKPSNFVLKFKTNARNHSPRNLENLPNDATVCLIDFGVARRYMNPDNSIRGQRPDGIPKFRGTNRYSSIRNYQGRELGRCDDLISLYYSIIEISCEGGLPWRHTTDKNVTCQMKKNFSYLEYHSRYSKSMALFLNVFYLELSVMRYEDSPDYDKYVTAIKEILFKLSSQEG